MEVFRGQHHPLVRFFGQVGAVREDARRTGEISEAVQTGFFPPFPVFEANIVESMRHVSTPRPR